MKEKFGKSSIRRYLCSSVLLKDIKDETIDHIMESGMILEFDKGYSLEINKRGLLFILEGSVRIEKNDTVVNILYKNDVFGFTSMFNEEKVNSHIVMNERTVFFIINQATVEQLVRSDSDFALRYIGFLTGKICFLNRKIAVYTANSVENKIMGYLLSFVTDNDTVVLPVHVKDLANQMNISRASFYRIIEDLENEGVIKKEKNKIKITDRNALTNKFEAGE